MIHEKTRTKELGNDMIDHQYIKLVTNFPRLCCTMGHYQLHDHRYDLETEGCVTQLCIYGAYYVIYGRMNPVLRNVGFFLQYTEAVLTIAFHGAFKVMNYQSHDGVPSSKFLLMIHSIRIIILFECLKLSTLPLKVLCLQGYC